MADTSAATPMMAQYLALKREGAVGQLQGDGAVRDEEAVTNAEVSSELTF